MSIGKTVRLHMLDGKPDGMQLAEIINWTGHVIIAPRSELAAFRARPEASRSGVYFLLGGADGQVVAYVGEGDNVGRRLLRHAKAAQQGGKDFWDRMIVLTSKDANLTKTHARYLESRFIALALECGQVRLDNATRPDPPPLPEIDRSDMEYVVEQVKILFSIRGISIFSQPTARRSSDEGPILPASAATGDGRDVGSFWGRPVHVRRSQHSPHGLFRSAVLGAYRGTCSITGAKLTPVLDAAHIRGLATGGESSLANGILLRTDVHALFDRGYLSVSPNYRLLVSPQLGDDYGSGGDEFYAKAGSVIRLPDRKTERPRTEFLEWHSSEVFRNC